MLTSECLSIDAVFFMNLIFGLSSELPTVNVYKGNKTSTKFLQNFTKFLQNFTNFYKLLQNFNELLS